ncbi:hypothetical protein llap_7151 [Limosa lapponica baueri]|uniref:Uncharacterized protein n=1 Tax=Limosa lapponica baueri TaxID=1758121 RepID=A0A2I0U938_LIMLA|nr:hypothetical protein llap_7151 [Limosa lapponica baueri]
MVQGGTAPPEAGTTPSLQTVPWLVKASHCPLVCLTATRTCLTGSMETLAFANGLFGSGPCIDYKAVEEDPFSYPEMGTTTFGVRSP